MFQLDPIPIQKCWYLHREQMIEIIIKNEKQTKIDNCEMIESVEFDKENETEIEIVFQIVCFL